jgi:2-amino-4-hydroxy-6-hydroxymethyldihydropteridine diphosphokinase
VSRAALALGSNLGDRVGLLQGAVDALLAVPGIEAVAVSPVYATDPVGGPADQPEYLNAVLVVDTDLEPLDLLRHCHDVERAAGRERSVRWAARTLDVDLLAVGATTWADDDLRLPHPRAHERAFVLVPWADVDPDFVLPGHGRLAGLAAAADRTGLRPQPAVALGLGR